MIMEPVNVVGTILLFIVAVVMIAAYPFSEFARGMASNPDAHEKSKGGCAVSIAGIILFAWLIASCVQS